MKMKLSPTFVLLIVLSSCLSNPEEETRPPITGRVVNQETQAGVPGATVVLYANYNMDTLEIVEECFIENSEGLFSFLDINNGRYTLQAFPPEDSQGTLSMPIEVTVSSGKSNLSFITLNLELN